MVDRKESSGVAHKASSARAESASGAFLRAGLSERLSYTGTLPDSAELNNPQLIDYEHYGCNQEKRTEDIA